MDDKNCISCGMPMTKAEDFAAGDTSKDFCLHCSTPEGNLISADQAIAGRLAWTMQGENYKMMGYDTKPTEAEARTKIVAYMKTFPAWKDLK